MLKEIFEQPNAVRETIGSRLPENEHCNFEDLKFTKEFLLTINKMYIVACGTAMHAGLSGKSAIEKLAAGRKKGPIPVEVIDMRDYGTMNGKAVFEMAKKLIGD